MNPEVFVLHGARGHLTLLEYLSRVLLYLLAVTLVGVGVHYCIELVAVFTRRP